MENEEEKLPMEDVPPPVQDDVEKVPDGEEPPPEKDEEKKELDDEVPPPSKDTPKDVKVNVIKPFKPGVRVSRLIRQGKCYFHPAKPASYICASCGKNVCNICGRDVNGTYFCPQCAPVLSRQAPAAPPEPKPPDTSWYKAVLAIGVSLIIIGGLLSVAYWPLSSINAAEFENLRDDYFTPEPGKPAGTNYAGYRPGDTITIRDTIVRRKLESNDSTFGTVTRFWFESTGKDDTDFWLDFDADLERDYHVGDEVAITFHVEEDSRFHNEVIKELDTSTLPDISNIDHTFSINIVFYSVIAIGIFLVILYAFFTKKAKEFEVKKTD
jgi:hypothetical protein